MAVNLKGRSFLTLMDFSVEEVRYLLDLSRDLKAKKRMGIHNDLLKGKNIVLLFEKASTRTRCAFEVAALEEGAHVTFLDGNSSQMGKKESLEDSAKVLGRFYRRHRVPRLQAGSGGAAWPGSPACRSGTGSPTWTTPPRSWPTSSPSKSTWPSRSTR